MSASNIFTELVTSVQAREQAEWAAKQQEAREATEVQMRSLLTPEMWAALAWDGTFEHDADNGMCYVAVRLPLTDGTWLAARIGTPRTGRRGIWDRSTKLFTGCGGAVDLATHIAYAVSEDRRTLNGKLIGEFILNWPAWAAKQRDDLTGQLHNFKAGYYDIHGASDDRPGAKLIAQVQRHRDYLWLPEQYAQEIEPLIAAVRARVAAYAEEERQNTLAQERNAADAQAREKERMKRIDQEAVRVVELAIEYRQLQAQFAAAARAYAEAVTAKYWHPWYAVKLTYCPQLTGDILSLRVSENEWDGDGEAEATIRAILLDHVLVLADPEVKIDTTQPLTVVEFENGATKQVFVGAHYRQEREAWTVADLGRHLPYHQVRRIGACWINLPPDRSWAEVDADPEMVALKPADLSAWGDFACGLAEFQELDPRDGSPFSWLDNCGTREQREVWNTIVMAQDKETCDALPF